MSRFPYAFGNHTIDDDDKDTFASNVYFDAANNYTFGVARKNGTTYISPVNTVGRTELKIGVLLPFHQHDNELTKMITLSGISAIRMAVAEINTKNLIPGAYITLIEQDSFPKELQGQSAISQAIFSAVSLIHEGIIAMIGDITSSWTSLSALMTGTLQIPQCSFSAVATSLSDKSQYAYFFRTIQTDLLFSDAALDFMLNQGWVNMGILYTEDDFGRQLAQDIMMKARSSGVTIRGYQSFNTQGPHLDVRSALDALMMSGVRIVYVAADNDAPLTAMIVAANAGYVNNDNVWLTIDMDVDALYHQVQRFNGYVHNISALPPLATSNSLSAATINGTSSSNATDNPILRLAQTTQNPTPIDFNTTFAGGIFNFIDTVKLPGYAPYDEFMQKWGALDPRLYAYGGQFDMSGHEGQAYSCLMTLAHGFNNVIHNGTNTSLALTQLATGQLGPYLTPLTFNASFTGPEGPVLFDQNGDLTVGNFEIFNVQNGSSVKIGAITTGTLALTSPPVFHDGSTHAPSGDPPKMIINPGFSSNLSIIIMAASFFGIFLTLCNLALVLVYRKREIFRISSPLFCVLELIGFLFCYTAAIFFVGDRNRMTCVLVPVAFNIGYSLVLGNLIAKNYRVYRIFNNIFIKQTAIKDAQLLQVSGGILFIVVLILALWFGLCDASTHVFPSSHDAYYVGCVYNGSSHTVFMTLLTLVAAAELVFSIYLAVKTRSVSKSYAKYSECKQIGIAVYNIFFSAIIGAIVFYLPATDYYTQHYLTATMIVWATTFCLFALFLPKVLRFIKECQKNKVISIDSLNNSTLGAGKPGSSRSHDVVCRRDDESMALGELMSVNGMLHSDRLSTVVDTQADASFASEDPHTLHHRQVVHTTETTKGSFRAISRSGTAKLEQSATLLDAYEANVPVQRVFRYFPFLSVWEMHMVVLMPRSAYFSCYSKKSLRGFVFGYTHATIASNEPGAYTLKVHGVRWWDLWMQVATEQDLDQWNELFNRHLSPSPSFLRVAPDSKAVMTPSLPLLDSGVTYQGLLDHTSCVMSATTTESTLSTTAASTNDISLHF